MSKKSTLKDYKNSINKVYGNLFKKATKLSELIEHDEEIKNIDKTYKFPLESTMEDEWDKYCRTQGVCSKELYPYKEKRDVQSIYNSHKNHPSIEISIEAKKIVDYIKVNSRTDKEIVQKINKWVSTYIDYDNVHAAASRLHKEGKNLIYLNAKETFETRVGICGEKALLMIGMLSYAGIPSTIYRPWFSHIAIITKTRLNQHFMCDLTYNKFNEVEPITEKSSKESYYEIGVSNITENYKWNWEKRRDEGLEFGIKNYGRELTPYELLDIERSLLCEPLKYGTLIGLLEQEKMLPTCKKLEEERKKDEEKRKTEKSTYNQSYFDWTDKDIDEWEEWKNYMK